MPTLMLLRGGKKSKGEEKKQNKTHQLFAGQILLAQLSHGMEGGHDSKSQK